MPDFDPTRPYVTHDRPHVTPHVLDATEQADRPVKADMRPKLPEGARWNSDGSVTLRLDESIAARLDGPDGARREEMAALTCRRLYGGDMIDAADEVGNSGRQLFLLQRMTGLAGPVGAEMIRSLSHPDFMALVEVLGVFTQRGQRTGR